MWDTIISDANSHLPKFNDYLLKDFRKQQIHKLEFEINNFIVEAIGMFEGKLQYDGYEELSPEERATFILENPSKYIKGHIDIHHTSCKLLRFRFVFEAEVFFMYLVIPFMIYDGILSQGTMCYPTFLFMDRGGLHVIQGKNNESWLIVKVARAPLTFWRKFKRIVKTVEGNVYTEKLLTVRIHQKTHTKKNNERTPLLLYPFAVHGFYPTLVTYGFIDDDLKIVKTCDPIDGYQHIALNNTVEPALYFRVKDSVVQDVRKLRVIISLMEIFAEDKKLKEADIVDGSASYFKVILGRFTFPNTAQKEMLYNYTLDHLHTNETLISPAAKTVFAGVGIYVNDIYELIHYLFDNLDSILVQYNPVDLYCKKIGQLDQLMSGVIKTIYQECFKIYNKKKPGLTRETLGNFMRTATNINEWFRYSKSFSKNKGSGVAASPKLFRSTPSLYNDNWLLQIGAKRDRSPDNVEIKSSKKNKKSFVSPALMKSHPSHLIVESFVNYPSSSPIVTGTINPFLEIDDDGNVLKPDYAEDIEHIFD